MNDIRIPYWRSRGRGFGSLILHSTLLDTPLLQRWLFKMEYLLKQLAKCSATEILPQPSNMPKYWIQRWVRTWSSFETVIWGLRRETMICSGSVVRNIPNRRLEWCVIQESRWLKSEIDIVKNADAVNILCTVNTVHGLRDYRKDGKPIECPILLTFS